jgi:hypothetical protein
MPSPAHEIWGLFRSDVPPESAAILRPECDSWMSGFSPAFSRALGERGWVGMAWPKRYGGHERSPQLRFAVIEELLAAGAPIAAHWFADRQVGPSLLKQGTEAQRLRLMPPMARGELYVCIGMSEPDAGSDLGSVATSAVTVPGGWKVTGSKIWTSHAAEAHYMLALVRTGAKGQPAATALTQVLIDMRTPGLTVRPIAMMDGGRDFCEVFFDDVLVGDDMVVGEVGHGWQQVLSELVFERGGPERFLSTFPMIEAFASELTGLDDAVLEDVGVVISRLATLREMSARVSAGLGRTEGAGTAAALVKDLGTRTELETIEFVAHNQPFGPPGDDRPLLREHLRQARLHSPGFTVRGGTNEILRGVVARTVMPR